MQGGYVVEAGHRGQPLRDLWSRRGVLLSLTLREVQVRYRQAWLGASWAVLQPLALMAVTTAVFHHALALPARGAPYPLFVFTALVPWTFFHTALSAAVPTLVSNANLVRKIWFPREALPASAVLAAGLDLVCALVLWLAWLQLGRAGLSASLLVVAWLLVVLLATTLALALLLSALNVYYRDVKHALPLLLQVLFFATPIVYPLDALPESARGWMLSNPLALVGEGMRAAAFEGRVLPAAELLPGSAVALVLLAVCHLVFRRAERRFADVV